MVDVVVDVEVEVVVDVVDVDVEVVTGMVVGGAFAIVEVVVSTAIDDVEPESVDLGALLLHEAIVSVMRTTVATRIGFTVGSLPRAVSIT